ncbi:MAG: hypothetical protein MUO50_15780 [Longimicrobiales bacterium]|nr:hypothetical protein [Longimicrobiales bacterium]
MFVLFLKILGGILALGIGLYMGSAARYRPDSEEIEKALSEGGRSKKVKRHFTPLGWLRQTQERSSRIRRRSRGASTRRFDLIAPNSKKKD